MALNDLLFVDNSLVVLREGADYGSPIVSYMANKSSLLRPEHQADKRLIKASFVVKFNRSGLGIIFD